MIKLDKHSTDYSTYVLNKENNILFRIKWDGCIDLYVGYNGIDIVEEVLVNTSSKIDNDIDYLHICDLEEFISSLQQLPSFKPKKADW